MDVYFGKARTQCACSSIQNINKYGVVCVCTFEIHLELGSLFVSRLAFHYMHTCYRFMCDNERRRTKKERISALIVVWWFFLPHQLNHESSMRWMNVLWVVPYDVYDGKFAWNYAKFGQLENYAFERKWERFFFSWIYFYLRQNFHVKGYKFYEFLLRDIFFSLLILSLDFL